jgi:hypothetical protein
MCVPNTPLAHEVHDRAAVAVTIDVRGQPAVDPLTVPLDGVDGVLEVTSSELSTTTASPGASSANCPARWAGSGSR